MPEEEFFEEKNHEDAPEKSDESIREETQEPTVDEGIEGYEDEGEDGEEEGGEKPFTIAELARAKTEKKIQSKQFSVLGIRGQEGSVAEAAQGMPEGQLAIDVYETPSEIVLKSTIAGVKPEDLDIGIEENTVNIRGSRHQEDKVSGGNYFYQECYWGTFSRSVILPVEVDSEKVNASLKDGILTIRLPKVIRATEKKIKVLTD